MIKIYKYPLINEDEQIVKMPIGAKILCIHNQYGKAVLWAEINQNVKETEHRYITMFITGESFNPPGPYIGTVLFDNGSLVLHYYERVFSNEND